MRGVITLEVYFLRCSHFVQSSSDYRILIWPEIFINGRRSWLYDDRRLFCTVDEPCIVLYTFVCVCKDYLHIRFNAATMEFFHRVSQSETLHILDYAARLLTDEWKPQTDKVNDSALWKTMASVIHVDALFPPEIISDKQTPNIPSVKPFVQHPWIVAINGCSIRFGSG